MDAQKEGNKKDIIAVIGLGYVGLPLAVEFSKKYRVFGFDINTKRIAELAAGKDSTREVGNDLLRARLAEGKNNGRGESAAGLTVTSDTEDIRSCSIYIVTVPTPIDTAKQPDLKPLIGASKTVGSVLSTGDIVIYESTVYPGCTEEQCVPVLERESGLVFNKDFFCGYSPERINPGDKQHRVNTIMKVTSGSTPEAAEKIDGLYDSIIDAGTHLAPSIKVAEAAKVIENSQRDINIAFVNELAQIFERIGIDTTEVLEAAGTKWNFLPFRPGLVGGHCIGVDPFYLTYKAQELGHHPEIILAGRRINDTMGNYVAGRIIKLMIKKGHQIKGASVLILGITFKENCPDIRNTRVVDVIRELDDFGCEVSVYDPWADPEEVREEYGIEMAKKPEKGFDAVVLAVSHEQFSELDYKALKNGNGVLFDIKSFLKKDLVHERL